MKEPKIESVAYCHWMPFERMILLFVFFVLSPARVISGCNIMPSDYFCYRGVTDLPVIPNSAAILAYMERTNITSGPRPGAGAFLNQGSRAGMPFNLVNGSAIPWKKGDHSMTFFLSLCFLFSYLCSNFFLFFFTDVFV